MLPAGDRRAQGGAVMKRFKVVSHRLDVKDPTNLVGLVSESHDCIDCGFNTAPRVLNRRELEKAYEASDRVEQWVDSPTTLLQSIFRSDQYQEFLSRLRTSRRPSLL
jgi:hypothetical protein